MVAIIVSNQIDRNSDEVRRKCSELLADRKVVAVLYPIKESFLASNDGKEYVEEADEIIMFNDPYELSKETSKILFDLAIDGRSLQFMNPISKSTYFKFRSVCGAPNIDELGKFHEYDTED